MNAFINATEGYAELGMWREAWEDLDQLPPAVRDTDAVLRLRLRCCPGFGAWALGEQLAALMRQVGPLERHAVAAFYHANARRLLKEGAKSAAAASIQAAVEAWPDYLPAIQLDSVIAHGFFEGVQEESSIQRGG